MTAVRARFTIGLTGAFLSSVVVLAQSPAQTPSPALLSETHSAVTGIAMDSRSRPLSSRRIQIRNLQTRQVERTSTTNRRGEFGFPLRPDLPYSAELTDATGQTLASSPTIVAHSGEIVSTVVKVPPSVATVSSTVLDVIGGALSAAATLGITAIDTALGTPPLDPPPLETEPPLSPEK